MKLRSRLLAILIPAIIVIIGIGCVILFLIFRSKFVAFENNLIISTARSKAEHISTLINQQKQDVVDIASASIFRDYFLDITNKVNIDKVQQRLDRTMAGNTAVREIYILDSKGVVLLSTDREEAGEDMSKVDNIMAAQNGPAIGEVRLYGDEEKRTIYTISAPIKDASSNFVGIFVMRYYTDVLNTIVASNSQTTKTEDVFLVNQNRYLLTPTRYLDQTAVLDKKIQTLNVERCFSQDEMAYVTGRPIGQRYIDEHKGHPAVTSANDYREVAVSATHDYVPELSACLIAKVDKSELSSLLLMLGVITFLIIGAAIIIFSIGLVQTLKISLKPIDDLRNAAEEIQKGNLGVVLTSDSKDEIGDLVRDFGKMAMALKTYTTGLEEKVKEKTTQLSQKLAELQATEGRSEKARLAITNILQDEKALEEELKWQKANVEDLVLKRTEELKSEKTKLLAAINSYPRAFILTDNSGRSILHNKLLSKMFVIQEGGSTVLEEVANQFKGYDFKGKFNEALTKKTTLNLQDISVGTKYYDVYIAPVMSESEFLGMLVTIKDDTEDRVMERSRDEFFSIASHELRTPLTAIKGNASMLHDFYVNKVNDPEFTSMISDMKTASDRLIGMVNDFLSMSRLEMGKIEFKKEKFNLVTAINENLEECRALAKAKNIDLTFAGGVSDLEVIADKDRVKEVLMNLVGNSLKYTDKGKINVSVEKNGVGAKVYISDTGRGIPPENQALLFRKFQQAGSSLYTRDTSKGTGLGLYISKLMVEGMGGTIKLEKSEEGVGSTFSFTLPFAS